MKLENKRILVTGAGGFIGSHLAELLAEKNEVLVVDDFSIGTRENLRAFARDVMPAFAGPAVEPAISRRQPLLATS